MPGFPSQMNHVGAGRCVSGDVENTFRKSGDTAQVPMAPDRAPQWFKLGINDQRVWQQADQAAAGGEQVQANIQKKGVAIAVAEREKFAWLCDPFQSEGRTADWLESHSRCRADD